MPTFRRSSITGRPAEVAWSRTPHSRPCLPGFKCPDRRITDRPASRSRPNAGSLGENRLGRAGGRRATTTEDYAGHNFELIATPLLKSSRLLQSPATGFNDSTQGYLTKLTIGPLQGHSTPKTRNSRFQGYYTVVSWHVPLENRAAR